MIAEKIAIISTIILFKKEKESKFEVDVAIWIGQVVFHWCKLFFTQAHSRLTFWLTDISYAIANVIKVSLSLNLCLQVWTGVSFHVPFDPLKHL